MTLGNGAAPMSDTISSPFLASSASAGSRLPSPIGDRSLLSSSRPTSTPPGPRGPAVHAATRDLWDVHRQIIARENSFIEELKRLGQPVPPMEDANSSIVFAQPVRTLEDEVTGALSTISIFVSHLVLLLRTPTTIDVYSALGGIKP